MELSGDGPRLLRAAGQTLVAVASDPVPPSSPASLPFQLFLPDPKPSVWIVH